MGGKLKTVAGRVGTTAKLGELVKLVLDAGSEKERDELREQFRRERVRG